MTLKMVRLEDLDWDDLRIFLAVARAGNLSQAAKQIKLDHSTVSRRIAQLELCLGSPLFERRREGLRCTPFADRILQNVEAMEGSAIALRENLGGTGKEPAGTVRLAMMEGIGSQYVARRLVGLLRLYPMLKVELITSAQLVNVNRREADIFISFFKPSGRGLNTELIGTFALNLYGSQGYFDRYGMPASVIDLAQHQFVGYVDDLIQVDAVRWLDEVIANPDFSFFSNSMLAQMAAASAGQGLVLLPRFAVAKEFDLIPILVDQVKVSRELWLSVHVDLQYSNRIRSVQKYLKVMIAEDQAYLNGV
jgi:DNA-binding transcriptional LysR family regulator